MAADDIDPAAERTLATLRREIDVLDTSLLELLMKRAVLSDRVAHAKGRRGGGAPVFRPGREMSILRRLVERVRGPLPADTVVAVWRQIIAASARQQGAFAVAAYAPDDETRYIDLAREHFGFRATIQRAATVASALAAVEKGRAQVAILPVPGDGTAADNGWWRSLGSRRPGELHILGRLPVLAASTTSGDAAIVGRQGFDRSEDDHGYLMVETDHALSRAKLRAALETARLEAINFPAAAEEKVARGRAVQYQLIETAEFVPGDDPRLHRLVLALGEGSAVRSLGGYAPPLRLSKRK